jgi:hypothetical protein
VQGLGSAEWRYPTGAASRGSAGTTRMPAAASSESEHAESQIAQLLAGGASVRIESTQPLPYQTAGDARGQLTELDLRLSSRTFRVLDAQPKKAA